MNTVALPVFADNPIQILPGAFGARMFDLGWAAHAVTAYITPWRAMAGILVNRPGLGFSRGVRFIQRCADWLGASPPDADAERANAARPRQGPFTRIARQRAVSP